MKRNYTLMNRAFDLKTPRNPMVARSWVPSLVDGFTPSVAPASVEFEMSDTPSDAVEIELLRRVAGGDRDAFGTLYDRTSGILYSLAVRILGDASLAEDVTQEVFMQVWDKAGIYDAAMGRPVTWMMTLTRNRAIDRLRSRHRKERLLQSAMEEPPPEENPGHHPVLAMQNAESAAHVHSALHGLPAEQRQAIDLAFFSGLTQTEISEALAVPLGTVKARIRRGMIQLRDTLSGLL